ncbi:MAG TPA: fructosamine kinase family protein [Gammaproteobacteria bacterium]|nr:fructosamine kinase family protein [Gammaproteobacteria bacterium]
MSPDSALKTVLERAITERAGDGEAVAWSRLGNGVGGTCWRARSGRTSWFVKSTADNPDMLSAEADGLAALASCHAVRVPQVLAAGKCEDSGYLIMEWLDFDRAADPATAARRLGAALARQHRCSADHFGWARHNFIGSTPQFNTCCDGWLTFFRDHRLGFQLRLAAENGYRGELQLLGARLMAQVPVLFSGHSPAPSLLHGDLWGGNWGVLKNGEPVVFDPAVYYGDREADIAMTELFGGFPPEFYAAYNDAWPLDPGYEIRRDFYNLYHLLNHLNLFGGAYENQALMVMQRLLASASRPRF